MQLLLYLINNNTLRTAILTKTKQKKKKKKNYVGEETVITEFSNCVNQESSHSSGTTPFASKWLNG